MVGITTMKGLALTDFASVFNKCPFSPWTELDCLRSSHACCVDLNYLLMTHSMASR